MLARKKMSPFFVRFWAHFRNKNNNIEMYILLHATILFHIISQNITKHGHAKNHTKYFICNILWRVKVSNMKCTPRLENEPYTGHTMNLLIFSHVPIHQFLGL